MLPSSHHNCCQEFLQVLEQFASAATDSEQNSLQQSFQRLQSSFQKNILPLADAINLTEASLVQSYITEAHRQMRLLQMDVIFLQASRNSATTRTRQATMSDRIKTLRGYCQTLLEKS